MKHTQPVRLVRIVTRLNVGGPSRHIKILSTRMGELNGVVLTGEPDFREGSMADDLLRAGVKIEEVPGLRRSPSPTDDLKALLWITRYLRQARPEIVATHMAKAGTLGRLASVLAGVPIRVHTFHGHVMKGHFGRMKSGAIKVTEKELARLTTRIIAVSPVIAGELLRMGIGNGKLTVIRNGLDLDSLTKAECGSLRQQLGIDGSHPLVGIVGRLAPVKSHETFLQAARLVLKERPDAVFVIVGDGPQWEGLHSRVSELELDGTVKFTGWKSELADVYPDLDVVVCCSLNEGTPSSLIEAGAGGCPVVATAVGGVPDVVQDGINGLLAPSGDVPAIGAAILRLLNDPRTAKRMGGEGRRLALERHGSDRMVSEVSRLYERLLETAAGRPRDYAVRPTP